MDPLRGTAAGSETDEDFRVRVRSKRTLTEQINRYKEVLRRSLDGQTDVDAETKRVLVEELLANFEAAVQVNVLVNGQTWEEAPDAEAEEEAADLESLLDDTIVETTRKRRSFPTKILPHVIHGLKAQRKILGLYEVAVKPEEMTKDPDQESIMGGLSAAAPGLVRRAIQVIKTISTLQNRAEGLVQVLTTEPSLVSQEIHRQVLGRPVPVLDPGPGTGARNQLPLKRALEEAAAAEGYVPRGKKPDREQPEQDRPDSSSS
ncbi:kinetochore-associated protein NSL1 homolog [Cololabis saira]|uniref:kinetochore-associated protein NSL1 homolog n=1 Tax=Cololabis saira TaxID=129043 RepID=UPI002AD24A11|nr:kinetochore-associated protein NSL1 homolog [Cololabis saira]